jgi:hypothetical protein
VQDVQVPGVVEREKDAAEHRDFPGRIGDDVGGAGEETPPAERGGRGELVLDEEGPGERGGGERKRDGGEENEEQKREGGASGPRRRRAAA